MNLDEVRSWVSEHRIAAVSVVLVLILGVSLVATALTIFGFGMGSGASQSSIQGGAGGVPESRVDAADTKTGTGTDTGEYVEVKEADMSIESDDLDSDVPRVRDITRDSGGYVERSSKTSRGVYVTARMTARVPSENFEGFINQTRDEFEVESYDVRSYRVSVEREKTELEILNQTLQEYERTRSEISEMDTTAEKLDLLMQVTDKELEVKEKMRRYRSDLERKQQRSEYATVRIELRERRQPELVPDDIGDRITDEIRQMIETVVGILISTVTGGVVVFFRAIQYLVYLVVVAIPLFAAYKLARWGYRRLSG